MSEDKKGKKKGGFLRSLLLEDETPSKANSSEDSSRTPAKLPDPVFSSSLLRLSSQPSFSLRPDSSTMVDPSMLAEVEQNLASQTSPTLTQFASLLSSMSGIPDEKMRITTALAVAKTTLQITPESIRAAYENRLEAIDRIESSLQRQADNALKEQVGGSEEEVAKCNAEINRRQTEIARLNSEISQIEVQKEERSSAIQRDREHIEDVKKRMQAAILAVRSKATIERDTVSRHIMGGS
jgi:hypothetical protein